MSGFTFAPIAWIEDAKFAQSHLKKDIENKM